MYRRVVASLQYLKPLSQPRVRPQLISVGKALVSDLCTVNYTVFSLFYNMVSTIGAEGRARPRDRLSLKASYDTRRFPLCAPFDGARGEDFLSFERDFKVAIADDVDEYSSLLECLLGTEPPIGNGASAAERRAASKRSRSLFGKLFKHITNEGLQKRLSELTGNDHLNGRSAWLLVEGECRPVISDLDVERLNADWVNASLLNTVGHVQTTCLDYKRYLNGLNADRPTGNKKTLTELATKFLNSFKDPESLALEAMKELKAVGPDRKFIFQNPADQNDQRNDMRDFDAIVAHFDKLWTHLFDKGLIRPKVARQSEFPSTRVDGEQYFCDEEAFQMGESSSSEMRCYNCHGFGHGSRDCPSEKKPRDMKIAITKLQAAHAKLTSTPGAGPSKPSGGGFRRGKGIKKGRKPISVYVLEDGSLEDSEGQVYTHQEEGVQVVEEDCDASQDDTTPEPDDEVSYIETRYSHLMEDEVCVVSDGEESDDGYWDYDDEDRMPPVWIGSRPSRTLQAWVFERESADIRPIQAFAENPKHCACESLVHGMPCASIHPIGPSGRCSLCDELHVRLDGSVTCGCPGDCCNPMQEHGGMERWELTHGFPQLEHERLNPTPQPERWDLKLGSQNSWNVAVDAWLTGQCNPVFARCHAEGTSSSEPHLNSTSPWINFAKRRRNLGLQLHPSEARAPPHQGSSSGNDPALWEHIQGNPNRGVSIQEGPCRRSQLEPRQQGRPKSMRNPDRGDSNQGEPRRSSLESHHPGRPPGPIAPTDVVSEITHSLPKDQSLASGAPPPSWAQDVPLIGNAATRNASTGSMRVHHIAPVDEWVYQVNTESTPRDDSWVVDCGATKHCVPSESCCSTIEHWPKARFVKVANGFRLRVTSVGDARVLVESVQGTRTMILSQVLVIPGLRAKLFSCKMGWRVDGIKTHLNDMECLELPCGARVPFLPAGYATRHYRVRQLMDATKARDALINSIECETERPGPNSPTPCDLGKREGLASSNELIHARLAHFGVTRIAAALSQCDGLPASPSRYQHDSVTCPSCQLAGARRTPIPKGTTMTKSQHSSKPRSTRFGGCVSSDLCGPFPDSSNGFRYAIVFVDSHSKWVAVYYLHNKTAEGVLAAHKQFLADYVRELKANKGSVSLWHTDNGGEFDSGSLDAFCIEMATRRSYSVPHVPQQNATSERVWGTILRPTRILLHAAGLPAAFWPFAMSHATYVHNRLPTRGLEGGVSPHHALYEARPDLSNVRVFGCLCYVRLDKRRGDNKLTPRGHVACHLGVDPYRKGYFVYLPTFRRLASVYHVKFDEGRFLPLTTLEDVPMYQPEVPSKPSRTPAARRQRRGGVVVAPTPSELDRATREEGSDTDCEGDPFVDTVDAVSDLGTAFSSSSISPTHVFSVEDVVGPIPIPQFIEEALAPNNKFRDKWLEACLEELKGKLGENRAWDLVHVSTVPKGAKVLKGKWVFALKTRKDGSIERFKARFVGCGYSQRKGIDFEQTFASTLKGCTFRLILATVCAKNMSMKHIDLKRFFTQQDLPPSLNLYVEQPPGFAQAGFVCKLRKALEGLKQSAHLGMNRISAYLTGQGFSRSPHDPCLYTKHRKQGVLILGVYVDDVLAAYSSDALFNEFWVAFSREFVCNKPEEVAKFMGLEISHDMSRGVLTIGQSVYIEQMFQKFLSGVHTKLYSTPVGTSQHELDKFMSISGAPSIDEAKRIASKDYLSIVGSLLWAACMTRPDVAYHTAFLCQFMQDPSEAALEAALGVLAYLQRTKTLALTFHREHPELNHDQIRMGFHDGSFLSNRGLHLYFDSSWNKVPKPFFGHVVLFMGGAVSWSARRMKIVPLSSAEAETACGSTACRDLQFVRFVLGELGHQLRSPFPVVTDSEATYLGTENPGATARTRHYERWLFYLRELAMHQVVRVIHTSTAQMMADIFTKAVDKATFQRCRNFLLK